MYITWGSKSKLEAWIATTISDLLKSISKCAPKEQQHKAVWGYTSVVNDV